jgi:hypothetical protein
MKPFKKGFVVKCAEYGIDKETAKALFEKLAEGIWTPDQVTPNPGATIRLTDPVPPVAPPKPMPIPSLTAMQLENMSSGEANRMRDAIYNATPHGTAVPAPGTLVDPRLVDNPYKPEHVSVHSPGKELSSTNVTGSRLSNLKGGAQDLARKGGRFLRTPRGKLGVTAVGSLLGFLGLSHLLGSGDDAAPEVAAAPMPPGADAAPAPDITAGVPAALAPMGIGNYLAGASLGGLGGAGLGYGVGSLMADKKNKDDHTARNMAIAGSLGGAGLVPLLQYLASRQGGGGGVGVGGGGTATV